MTDELPTPPRQFDYLKIDLTRMMGLLTGKQILSLEAVVDAALEVIVEVSDACFVGDRIIANQELAETLFNRPELTPTAS